MEARRENNTEWVKHSLLYKEYSAELRRDPFAQMDRKRESRL